MADVHPVRRQSSGRSYANSGIQASVKHEYETSLETYIQHNIFSVLALCGLVLGILLGFSLKYTFAYSEEYWHGRMISYLKFPSQLFYQALLYVKLPLTVSCIGAAIGSMDLTTYKFAVWRVFAYIIVSTLLAALVGGVVAILMQPGQKKDHPIHQVCYIPIESPPPTYATCSKDHHPCNTKYYSLDVWTWKSSKKVKLSNLMLNKKFCGDSFHMDTCEVPIDNALDLVESFFPENIVTAFLSNIRRGPDFELPDDAKFKYSNCQSYVNAAHPKPSAVEYDVAFNLLKGTNYKAVITFISLMATAALYLDESGAGITGIGRPILNIFTSLSHCTLTIGTWIIWFSTIGICSRVAGDVLEDDLFELPWSVYRYILTTVVALLFYAFGVLPFLYKVLTSKSPFRLYKRIIPAIGVSFSTSSSTATIPVMMKNLEEACHLDPRIVRLMVPINADSNLNGSTLRTVVAIIYIAQLHGVTIDTCAFFTIVFMTTFSVLTTFLNQTTNAFLHFRLLRVLQVIGLPGEFSVYVLAVDSVLDHVGSMANVISNCVGIAIVEHYCFEQLDIFQIREERKAAALSKFYFGEPEPLKKENSSNIVSYAPAPLPTLPPPPSAQAQLAQVKLTKRLQTQNQDQRETKATNFQPIVDPRFQSRSRSAKSSKHFQQSKNPDFIINPTKRQTRQKDTKSVKSFKSIKSNKSGVSEKEAEDPNNRSNRVSVKKQTLGNVEKEVQKRSRISTTISRKKNKKSPNVQSKISSGSVNED